MATVKITITIDEPIYKLLKTNTANMSKYIEQLIKADIFKTNELDIYNSIVKRLTADGHIGNTPISTPIPISNGYPCCLKATPCKHWTYDGVTEEWTNSLTGEIRNT